MLSTSLGTAEIPLVFRRFAEEIGDSHWSRVAADRRRESKHKPLLHDYLAREYDMVFQLDRLGDVLKKYGTLPNSLPHLRPFYSAAGFAAQIVSLLHSWPQRETTKLKRRVCGALRQPSDLRALQAELAIATHFLRRGWSVAWPETLGVAGETFDLLVERPNVPPLEIECKSIGLDTGQRVPRREAIEFCDLLRPHLRSTLRGLSKGLSVAMTVPVRLPNKHADRIELAKALGEAIFTGTSCTLPDSTDVRISGFDSVLLGEQPDVTQPHELRRSIDGITATKNRPTMLVGNGHGGAIVSAIQSSRDDQLLKAIFNTLSDASSRQLTGKKAGMLVTSLDGIQANELRSIAEDDNSGKGAPSGLQAHASRFLASVDRAHIVGLTFMSRPEIRPIETEAIDSIGGVTYHFPRRESSFWNEAYADLFEVDR